MGEFLDLPQIAGNTTLNYVTSNQADDALGRILGAAQIDIPVTTADVDLTTGDPNDPTSQIYKALRYGFHKFTDTLTAARNVIVPNNKRWYFVEHAAAGGFTITVKTSAGSGVALSNGDKKIIRCDGTNVVAFL